MRNGSRGAAVSPAASPQSARSHHRDSRLGRLAYALIIAAVLGGLLWIWQSAQNVRGGTVTIAGAMFAAALARLLLPEQAVRLLSSRRRLLDVAAYGALGVALLVAGLIVPGPT
jgi:Protein of unknown function (DUF3017)